MGTLPPQGVGSGSGGGGSLSTVIVSGEDEAFVTSITYSNVLVVDLQTTIDHVIDIVNTDAVISVQYKIYASPKVGVSAPIDADDSWFNVLNGTDQTLYDNDLEKSLPALKKVVEGLSNRFAWLRIQLKSSSGTPTIKMWVRGTNL